MDGCRERVDTGSDSGTRTRRLSPPQDAGEDQDRGSCAQYFITTTEDGSLPDPNHCGASSDDYQVESAGSRPAGPPGLAGRFRSPSCCGPGSARPPFPICDLLRGRVDAGDGGGEPGRGASAGLAPSRGPAPAARGRAESVTRQGRGRTPTQLWVELRWRRRKGLVQCVHGWTGC